MLVRDYIDFSKGVTGSHKGCIRVFGGHPDGRQTGELVGLWMKDGDGIGRRKGRPGAAPGLRLSDLYG